MLSLIFCLQREPASVRGGPVRMRLVPGPVIRLSEDRFIGGLRQGQHVMGGMVGKHQEGILPRIPDGGHAGEAGQDLIAPHEQGIGRAVVHSVGVQIVSVVIEPALQHHRRDAEQAVSEEIPDPDGSVIAELRVGIRQEQPFRQEGPDLRQIRVDAQIGNPLIARQGRIANRDPEPCPAEYRRHNPQGFVMLFRQRQILPPVHPVRRVGVSAEKRRRAGVGMAAVGEGIGIAGEAGELFPQEGLFLKQIRCEGAHSLVQHQHDHVFPAPVQGDDAGRFPGSLRGRLGGQPLHLRNLPGDFRRVHGGQGGDGRAFRQTESPEQSRFPFPKPDCRSRQEKKQAEIQQDGGQGDLLRHRDIEPQQGGQVAVPAEKPVVQRPGNRQEGQRRRKGFPDPAGGEMKINHPPEEKGAGRSHKGALQKDQGRFKPGDFHELRGGGADQSGGNEDPGQQGQDQAADQHEAPVPGGDSLRLRTAFRRAFGTEAAEQIPDQGEQIVHRPVQHQP